MMREPGASGKRRKYEGGLTVPLVPWARYVCATSSTVSGSLPTRTSRTCPWGITANSGLRSDVKRKTVSFVVIHVRRHRTPQDVHTPRPGWHAQRTLATGWSLGSLSTRAGLRPADTARRLAGRRTAQGARRWRLLHRSRCSAQARAASCDRAGVGDRERLPYGVGGPCAPRRRHARSLIQIVPHSAWRRVVRCSHLVALQTDGALRPDCAAHSPPRCITSALSLIREGMAAPAEELATVQPASRKCDVLVVGAGIAGLTA